MAYRLTGLVILASLAAGGCGDGDATPTNGGPVDQKVPSSLIGAFVRTLASDGHLVLFVQGARGDPSEYFSCLEQFLRELPSLVDTANVTVVVWPDMPENPPIVIEGQEVFDTTAHRLGMVRGPAWDGGGLDKGLEACSDILKAKGGHVLILAAPSTQLSQSLSNRLKDFSTRHLVHAVVIDDTPGPFTELVSGYVLTVRYGKAVGPKP